MSLPLCRRRILLGGIGGLAYMIRNVETKRYGANHGNAGALRVLVTSWMNSDRSIHSADGRT